MKVTNGNIIISANFEENSKIEVGAVSIEIDTTYNPLNYSTNNGIVEVLPIDYDGVLKLGDRVYGNHFLCDNADRFYVEGVWWVGVPMDEIYFYKRDGVLTPMPDKYLCLPIKEQDFSSLIENPFKSDKDKMSTVFAVSELETEISVGDTLFYIRHADYDIKVDGVDYLCVWNKDLCQAFEPKK